MLEPDFEVLPRRARVHSGKLRPKLVIASNFFMPGEGFLDFRHEDIGVVASRYVPSRSERHDIIWKAGEYIDHG